MIGEKWMEIQNYKDKAICAKCIRLETMKHIQYLEKVMHHVPIVSIPHCAIAILHYLT
jgi:hypothetical protein